MSIVAYLPLPINENMYSDDCIHTHERLLISVAVLKGALYIYQNIKAR